MQADGAGIYDNSFEVHDKAALGKARALIDSLEAVEVGREVLAAVDRNRRWRGEQCINLLAPEAPTSASFSPALTANDKPSSTATSVRVG